MWNMTRWKVWAWLCFSSRNLPGDRASATCVCGSEKLAFTKSKSQNMPGFKVALNGPPSAERKANLFISIVSQVF